MDSQIDCICQDDTVYLTHNERDDPQTIRCKFNRLFKCPVVSLFIDNELLDNYLLSENIDKEPKIVGAFVEGDLKTFLTELHPVVVDAQGEIRLREEYKGALKEKWIKENDEGERDKRKKAYEGKPQELRFASYLKSNGYEIINMEAWDKEAPDIVAKHPDDTVPLNIELKYTGIQGYEYKAMRQRRGWFVNPCDYSDYALFKLCSALKQLLDRSDTTNSHCLPVLIITSFYSWISESPNKNRNIAENICQKRIHNIEKLKEELPDSNHNKVVFKQIDKLLCKLDNFWIFFDKVKGYKPYYCGKQIVFRERTQKNT